jgi:hypothetical protein
VGSGRNRASFSKLRNRTWHFATVTDGHDTKVFEVLIRQITENAAIDVIFDKALGGLGHVELLEPARNLLHRRPPTDLTLSVLYRHNSLSYVPPIVSAQEKGHTSGQGQPRDVLLDPGARKMEKCIIVGGPPKRGTASTEWRRYSLAGGD